MSYGETAVPMDMENDEDPKVYITLSLSKYPFLKNAKIDSTGEANFKGEIMSSSKHPDEGSISHEVMFNDLMPKKGMVRV